MIITLVNFISEKINNFKRENRNKPSFYKLFLLWFTLIILITTIFYIIDNLNNEFCIYNIESPINDISENNDIKLPNLISNLQQDEIYNPPKSDLYSNILNDIGKIPKPLSFVDDFDFNL